MPRIEQAHNRSTDLLQISHHVILAAAEHAAEEFDDLLVVEVVHALHHAGQQQLHRQVQVTVEFIYAARGEKRPN